MVDSFGRELPFLLRYRSVFRVSEDVQVVFGLVANLMSLSFLLE